ncbi:alpha/beta hydrolase-fold protein [Pseudoalteromonas sp. Ps84H-4]|uniref:alpha/beta hydrolase n=1 Tax=Pseudoalteromonas sp. Ps84H-4 TaxID=2954502 RepID=UPI00209709D0|nr:alpha/beta hydrolase-fold protein [Pseudoalteromonas sp. Ps84H-4]MCO7250742.1 alpha/beta hydrolase-fold protein [Pseudoalteromonas sp. Ps84H-4]
MKLPFVKCLALIFMLNIICNNVALAESHRFEIANSKVVTIESTVLGKKYDLFIKVPRSYFLAKNKSKKYPVLYLNDGPYTFKVAAGVTHMRNMDKVIVVGISFAHGENGQFSRVRDLTPVVDQSWTKYTTGGATDYLAFIEKEVFQYIERNYRVNTEQKILSGQSLGGSFAAWVLLTKPELFSTYILTSPSLWFKNDWIFELENKYAEKNKSLQANVFMATGALETLENGMKEDMVAGHVKFANRLRSRNYQGLKLADEVVEGTDHYSTFPVGLSKGLVLFYESQ